MSSSYWAPEFVHSLKTNPTLATLDLSNNLIGDKGAKALAETLKTNLTLITLYMSSYSIGDNGDQALAEALKINSILQLNPRVWSAKSGKVKWFSASKGYGFITPDPDGNGMGVEELFAHYTSIMTDGFKTLDEGAAVTFCVEKGPMGSHATDIRLDTDAPQASTD
ncbi:CSD-domain-containing protein [Linnemannia elongata AG-77]|uniref:CSD-domain-containing protein n=1 Tax=Linnemannia elongata AG-77 TaxID=1314771 RepID=A0A197JTD8_9FUNG|nr:CSD-domain-containing protein [Linnemannia elongata AG-77]